MIIYECDRCGRSKFKEEDGGPNFGFRDLERTQIAVERYPVQSPTVYTPRRYDEEHKLGDLCKYCREALRESLKQFIQEWLA